ncbi:MAG: DUF2336 domain-containing protein [Rhizobiales bacterium]|nr:DUF2336 domain-containing protein [Hyphomicrobiales bacterium]
MQQDLWALAHESSSEKRLELLRKLSEMYFEEVQPHTDAEDYLFGQIVDRIVDTIAKPEKVVVANTMAVKAQFPHEAAVRLARDEDVDIAGPVLAESAALTSDDLVSIAGAGSQSHMRAIASRRELDTEVTDVLVDRGNSAVVQTVSANPGARFSDQGLDGLVDRAGTDVNLRELLVERPDLSQTAVDKLLPLVSANLAVKLAERGYDVGDALPPEMIATVSERLATALRQRKNRMRDTSSLIEAVKTEQLSLDEAACLLTHGGRLFDLSVLLSAFAGIERDYLFALLSRGQLQAVMILFRGLGLEYGTLERTLEVRERKAGRPIAVGPQTRTEYELINPATARRTLRFSHVRRAAAS